MTTRLTLAALACAALLASPLQAQQHIALDAATVSRLGLVFMAVSAADDAAGARFPARVAASPQLPSEMHAVHAGVLESWQVRPGDAVSAGDVLAIIRSTSALALQQQWVQAQAAEQQAAFELQRDRALLEQGIIAEQRFRETERRAREAEFALRAAQSALLQTGYAGEELARLRDTSAELGRYRVRAPFDGVISHINHPVGDMVMEGEALLSLREEHLWVTAELPAQLAARVAIDQPLRLADQDVQVMVRMKDTAIDSQLQTVGIQAELSTATDLIPGQAVTLLLPALSGGILVPADAVVREGANTIVYVRVPGGIESRVLSLQPLGANYLATSGLAEGEELVVRGASLLKGITLGLGGE